MGVDAAMLALSALLCGLPDGRVYVIPTPGPSAATSCFSRSTSAPHPPIRARPVLLHDLQQPVVLAASVPLPRVNGACSRDGHDCLVLVGAEGEVVLVTPDDKPCGSLVVRELHVQGPVLTACCHDARLLYSSPRGVFSVHLTAAAVEEDPREAPAPLPASVKLYDCCALALCCLPQLGDGGEERMVAVTVQRRLVLFDLPCLSKDEASQRFPASHPGHAARDLLAAISSVSDRVRLVNETLRRQDSDLQSLHLCSDVCRQLSAPVGANGRLQGTDDCPIELRVSTLWTQSLCEEQPSLRCELRAGARGGGLQGSWTLIIEVSGTVRHSPPLGRTSVLTQACTAHSFPVKALSPGGRVEVVVPLNCVGAPLEMLAGPVVVQCFLHGGLPRSSLRRPSECHGANHTAVAAPDGHGPYGVTLLIGGAVVDALSCLRPVPHSGLHPNQVLAEPTQEVKAGGAVPTILTVRVSEATANRILGPAASGAHAGPCRALLTWLLSESPGVADAEPLSGPSGGCVAPVAADGITPDGHPTRLAITQVQVNSVPVLEVSITCPSLVSLCALHLAVTRRLQCSERGVGSARQAADSPCGGGETQLTVEAHPRLQALLAEVQALQEAHGGALHGEGSGCRELQLYLRLRAARVPLLL